MDRTIFAAALVSVIGLALALVPDRPAVLAQDAPPMMKVDFIATTSGYVEGTRAVPSELCVMLPAEASTVTVSRRAFLPEAGTDRQLTMTITPFVSTGYPLVEQVGIRDTFSLILPELGGETCFSFMNQLYPREVQAAQAQAYKYYAQITTIEIR